MSPNSGSPTALLSLNDWAAFCLAAPSFQRSYPSAIELLLAILVLGFLILLFHQLRLRMRAQASLTNRYELEKQVSDFSERLAMTSPEHIDSEIEIGLRNVLGAEDASKASWYVQWSNADTFELKYCTGNDGDVSAPRFLAPERIPGGIERLLDHGSIVVPKSREFPLYAERERQFLGLFSANSVLLVPAGHGTSAQGLLVLASRLPKKRWAPESVSHLRVLGNIIAAAAQRTHAQRAQTASDVRFHHLFEQASIGIALETLDGTLLHVNPALCAMLGYPERDLVRLTCGQLSHPDDLEIEKPLFNDLRQGLISSYQLRKRFFRGDKSVIWGDISVSLMVGTPLQAPQVIAMVRDITLAKAAEERLISSETRLQSTLDSLSKAIAILDENGTILAVNAKWSHLARELDARFRGLVPGANFFAFSYATPGDRAEFLQEVAEKAKLLVRGEPPTQPRLQRWQSEAGSEVWYQVTVARFEENGLPRVVLSYIDVTELIRARRELAHNEERLSMALEASNTGTWEWDIATGQFWWKDNRISDRDVREEEFQGDYLGFLEQVHPEDRKKIEDATERALHGAANFSAEFRMKQGNGSSRWFLGKGKVFRDSAGRPIRMLGANVDITELKRRDIELQVLASRLIQAQEDERRRISRELHDDIAQQVSLLANELESLSQAMHLEQQPHTVEVQNLRQQTEELATDIHELSHELHSSKLQHLGLRAALRELCEKVSEKRQVHVSLHTDDVETRLPPDVALCLYRVAQEALNNAIKHSHAQEVDIRIGIFGDAFRLIVRDTGVGFDPSTVTPGLGLVGMRERLHTVGGELQVKSSSQTGTEVTADVFASGQTASTHA